MRDKIVAIEIVGCGVVVEFDDGWKMTLEGENVKELVRNTAMTLLNLRKEDR